MKQWLHIICDQIKQSWIYQFSVQFSTAQWSELVRSLNSIAHWVEYVICSKVRISSFYWDVLKWAVSSELNWIDKMLPLCCLWLSFLQLKAALRRHFRQKRKHHKIGWMVIWYLNKAGYKNTIDFYSWWKSKMKSKNFGENNFRP